MLKENQPTTDGRIPEKWADAMKEIAELYGLPVCDLYNEVHFDTVEDREKYFNDPGLKVKWSGWKTHRSRKIFNIKTGNWTNSPCKLESLLKRGMAPASAYTPLVPGVWNELARLKLRDDTLATFLMTAKVGKGLLVLTSADFGLSGGLAIFGNRKMQSVQLLQNLYQLSQGAK